MSNKLSKIIKLAKDLNKSDKDSSGVWIQGIVTKNNQKTLQVTTPDNYYVNIPATYLSHVTNPSEKLLDFKKQVAATYEEMYEILQEESKKDTFH